MRYRVLVNCCILLLFALGPAVSADTLTVVQPQDGEALDDGNVVFGWESCSCDSYRFILSSDADFTDPVRNTSVNDPYYTYNGLEAGEWYWKVKGLRGNDTVASTGPRHFAVYNEPDPLSADVVVQNDTVSFSFQAQEGATISLGVSGANTSIRRTIPSFSGQSIELELEQEGSYTYQCNQSYYDALDTAEGSFTVNISDPVQTLNTTGSGENVSAENDSEGYTLHAKAVHVNGTEVDPVANMTVRASSDSLNRSCQGEEGSCMLNITEGNYTVVFNASGYEPEVINHTIEGDEDIRVRLDTKDIAEVSFVEPSSEYSSFPVVLNYSVNTNASCELLFGRSEEGGWRAVSLDKEGWHSSADTYIWSDPSRYVGVAFLEPGAYAARIQCVMQQQDKEIQTRSHSFTVESGCDGVNRSLVGQRAQDFRSRVSEMSPIYQQAIERTKVMEGMDTYVQEAGGLQAITPDSNETLEDLSVRLETKCNYLNSIEQYLPSNVSVSPAYELVLYLPRHGFDERKERYILNDNTLTRDMKTFYHRELPEVQEQFMARVEAEWINVSYFNGSVASFVLVSKEVEPREQEEANISAIVEYVPEDMNPRFLSPVTKKGENLYRSEKQSYVYMLKGSVGSQRLKDTGTIVLPPYKPEQRDKSAVTGQSVRDDVSAFLSPTLLYAVLIMASVGGVGMVLVPGSPLAMVPSPRGKVELLTKKAHAALGHIEKKGVGESVQLLEQVLGLYERMSQEERQQVQPVVQEISVILERHTLEQTLSKAERKIHFLKQLYAFDPAVFAECEQLVNDAHNSYARLSPQLQGMFQERLRGVADALQEMKNNGNF